MRTYCNAVLCCVCALLLACSAAQAQDEKFPIPQIAEDSLARIILPAAGPVPAVQPAYPPIVDKQISHESTTPLSLKVAVHFPELGLPAIDAQVAHWATNMATNFQENVTKEAAPDDNTKYELQGNYTVSRPSPAAVSITYEVWTYTGGAHGNRDIITLNFDTEHGEYLALENIFADTEQALELMSTYCYSVLSAELGTDSSGTMLKSGTSPDTENFSALTLLPAGVIVHFQPYQVAPWSSGPQKVSMSLEDLADAKPHLELWGRAGK